MIFLFVFELGKYNDFATVKHPPEMFCNVTGSYY